MRAYSQDLRERVLRAVDEGKPRAQIIELFHVSRATIKGYLKQRRETGTLQPRPLPGRPARKGALLRAHVSELLQERPDARLEDSCQIWESQHGIQVSPSTMSRAIRQANDTRKKRLMASHRTPGSGQSRLARANEWGGCQAVGGGR